MKRNLFRWALFTLLVGAVAASGQQPPQQPAAAQEQEDCTTVGGDDERCRTQVSIYTGMVIDSFAAAELNKYVNPNVADDIKTSFVAGVDAAQYVGGNTWLFLETVNGVRSVDVKCDPNSQIEVCKENAPQGNTNAEFLYILRNARTLEAFLGARYELGPSDTNGRWYGKSQLGFISVAGAGKDIVDNHIYFAGGFIVQNDMFADSYVEIGIGKNDIFENGGNRRIKFDGLLTSELGDPPPNSKWKTRWFLQMTVDSDFRSGADSIQIYLGLDFNLRNFDLNL